MTSDNKLSILMPIYNEEKFIVKSIQSIINQSYSNFELVIVDDFSDDNSYQICKDFSESDSRIILKKNISKGKVHAFNLAYSISTGSFFCSVHGDDYIPKQSFEKRISPLLLFGNDYAASACKIQMFSKDSRFDGVITPRDKNKGTFIGASIMYTKKIAQKIYPIPKTLPSEDRWQGLCIENLNKNTFHVPEVLYFYRIHANNSSSRMSMFENKNISMHKRFMVFKLFYDKFKSDIGESKKKKILALIEAEKSRYNNKSWKILFIKNLSIKNKIRFLFHSNKFLYSIRISFFRFFSGWGE